MWRAVVDKGAYAGEGGQERKGVVKVLCSWAILLAAVRFAIDTANVFVAFTGHELPSAHIGYLVDVTQPLFTTKHSESGMINAVHLFIYVMTLNVGPWLARARDHVGDGYPSDWHHFLHHHPLRRPPAGRRQLPCPAREQDDDPEHREEDQHYHRGSGTTETATTATVEALRDQTCQISRCTSMVPPRRRWMTRMDRTCTR
ncbi:hypothetical protein LXA43DRAFT_1183265 [Ganoderma leucocontextum]|nr:hypothetical protein LXA43DRAFT_1183265 [Ganoderma leucocontextum]